MANEFVAKNGLISQNNTIVSGSLTVTQGITGSLFGTASWATNAQTASNGFPYSGSAVITGSLIVNDGNIIDTINTTQWALKDSGGTTSVDWNGKVLKLADNRSTVDWGGARLNDYTSEALSVDWEGRILYDTDAKQSIDWQSRVFYANDGLTSHLNWSNPLYMQLGGISESPITNILGIDGGGRLYYTASSAIGGGTNTPTFPYTGSAIISGSLIVTGSTISTLGFTGSLFGTSSWATNALTASLASTSSRLNASNTSIFAASSDRMIITASNGIIMNASSVGIILESDLYVTGSVSFGSLITSPTTHVLTYDTFTKLVHFTASSAISSNFISSVIGNNLSSSFDINHGFNTRNLHITVYESSSNGETVYPDIRRINANTASIIFANPPSSNQYIVYISQ